MASFRRKRGTYKVQEDNEHVASKSSKKKMMTCFVDLLDDNTMNIEIEVNLLTFQSLNKVAHCLLYTLIKEQYIKDRLKKGGPAFHFGKTDFELGVGGQDQDTSRHFNGSFGSIRAILPM